MSGNTLQGWCSPTDLTDYADHTFVYCPDNGKYFVCWGGGNIHAADTVRVCSNQDGSAYCRANNYRMSVGGLNDTAGVGIYGINGVCHQSANLFLYSAGSMLPLTGERPRGIIASHAMYGVYGTNIPGPGGVVTWPAHFAAWYSAIYLQAKARCWFSNASTEANEINQPEDLFHKINALHSSILLRNQSILSAEDLIVSEFKILTKDIVPDIDIDGFEGIHRDLLKEKEGILRSANIYGDTPESIKLPQGKQAEALVEKLNELACDFQNSLARNVGNSHYEQLTGNTQNDVYKIIDPRIAVENWKIY